MRRTLPIVFRRAAVCVILALAACVPHVERGPAPRRRALSPPVAGRADPLVMRQCLADLGAHGAVVQQLPDQDRGNGCSTIGTVKLVKIVIPTANLGAMKCRLAERFVAWTNEALQNAAAAWLDSRVAKIESYGTYACRPVNNQPGNRLSEHGSANAVDIAGFVLANGRRITVKADWNGPDENARNFLRAVHKAACRRFSVVLGPDANALHADHLHFDMGQGRYCR